MLGICFKAYGLGSRSRDREAPVLRSHGRFSSYTMRVQTGCSRAEAFVPVGYSEGSVWTQSAQVYCGTLLLCVGGWGAPDRQEGVRAEGAHGTCGGRVRSRLGAQATWGRSARALPGWRLPPSRRGGEASSPRGPVGRLACEGEGTARQRLTNEGRGEQERSFFWSWWRAASRDSKATNAAVKEFDC